MGSQEREPAAVGRDVRFGYAKLLPDIDRPHAWLLTLDGTAQSYVDLADPGYLEFEYARRFGHIIDGAAPPGTPLDALHLGGGALTLPRYLAATRPGSRQHVVEADGPLVSFVLEQLPLPPASGVQIHIGDAREWLTDLPAASMDLVLVDVFSGTRVPAHLTTIDFVRSAGRLLRPGGMYAVNLADEAPFDFLRPQVATLCAVLPRVCLIAEAPVLRGRRFGNVILLGARRELPIIELTRKLAADPFPARVAHGLGLQRFTGDAAPVDDAHATASPIPPEGAFGVD